MSSFTLLSAVVLGLAGTATAGMAQKPTVVARSKDSVAGGALLSRPARLDVRQVRLASALIELRNRSGVDLAFSPTFLTDERLVSCRCADLTVGAALDNLLRGTGFRYVDMGLQVVIEPPLPRAREMQRPITELAHAPFSLQLAKGGELPRFGATPAAPEQAGAVAGIVQGTRGQALSGARVTLTTGVAPGATGTEPRTATTDENGRFRFQSVPGSRARLGVVAIGFQPLAQTVQVGDENVRLVLTESVVNLSEVVVTGTPGATEKRALGNSVSQIKAADVLDIAPITDVSQLINGRAAGVLVRGATGAIGGGSRITLRGSATLGLNDQPLIYVDGVRVDSKVGVGLANEGNGTANAAISRLNDFNPDDIESVEIIKGPAAATLYGTEAANGVIQIITKKGRQAGTTTWDAKFRQGGTWFQNPAGRFGRVYGRGSSGELITIDPYQMSLDQGEDHFRTGHLQGYGLSAAGGTGQITYFAGGAFDHDKGTDITQNLTDYSARLNLGIKPSERLEFNTSMVYLSSRTQVPTDGNVGGALFAYSDARPALLNTPRRGWLFASPEEWDRAYQTFDDVHRFTGSLQVTHRPTGWLTHRLTVGADLLSDDFNLLVEKLPAALELAFGAGFARGGRSYEAREATNTTVDYGASATAKLTSAVKATSSVGFQYYHKQQRTVSASGTDFPAAGITTVSATATRNSGETFLENNTVGLYLQEQLTLKDRVYLTGAIRADDNSAFGANFDVAKYPKASIAWVLSEEPFWKFAPINTLKLRGAYGASGQQPDAFAALRAYEPVTGTGGVPAVRPAQIGNPDLKPERSRELELGLDASLFQDRIGVEFTYYEKKTTDAITARQLAPSGGFPGTQLVNVGELSSKGIELLVNARLLNVRKVGLDVGLNLATSSNDVVRTGSSSGFLALGGAQRHADGFPVAAFFGQKVVSTTLNSTTKLAENILCDGGTGKLGLEQGGAPVPCATAPAVLIGRSLPTAFGAVTSTLTLFDRLQLYAMVDFQTGFDRVDYFKTRRCNAGTCEEFFFPEKFDIIKVAEQQLRFLNTFGIDRASFAKLREVSATYTVPDRVARSFGVRRAAISIAGRHLHTWTGFSGLDPEPIRLSQAFNVNQFAITAPPASLQARIDVTF